LLRAIDCRIFHRLLETQAATKAWQFGMITRIMQSQRAIMAL
jgi:hypothetical protein